MSYVTYSVMGLVDLLLGGDCFKRTLYQSALSQSQLLLPQGEYTLVTLLVRVSAPFCLSLYTGWAKSSRETQHRYLGI